MEDDFLVGVLYLFRLKQNKYDKIMQKLIRKSLWNYLEQMVYVV